jgi:mono/diheme cytochrome c family protein
MNWKSALAALSMLLLPAAAAAETPLERGTYLMNSIVACGNCHTIQTPDGPMPGMELAGGMLIEDPAFKVNVPNITPDPETGIGKWTDEQIIAAIREGRRPDGSIIGPPMPIARYRGMSDADAAAIVAYLRGVKPVKNAVQRSTFPFPLPPNYGPPVGPVEAPPRGDAVAYGAYLAGPLGHCIECHSTPNAQGIPDVENGLGAGGLEFHGPWGVSVALNITPTGLGSWTDDQIKAAITKGIKSDGSRLKPPMGFGYYANLSADDLTAIVAYLRSLPPK